MGEEKNNNSNINRSVEEVNKDLALIDFLYLDTNKLNSFISQINNGTLQSVSTKSSTMQGSNNSYSGNASIPAVAQASTSRSASSSNVNEEILNYNPYHSQYVEILNDLLSYIQEFDSSNDYDHTLCFFEGAIQIRSAVITDRILRANLKHKKAINGKWGNEEERNIKCMLDFNLCIGEDITFNILSNNNLVASGTMDESFLFSPITQIVRGYAGNLPGDWHIVGIFDTWSPQEIDTNAPPKFEDFTNYLYNINNTYTRISACKVIPIAIYKPIKF